MFHLSNNGVKITLASFSLINISLNKKSADVIPNTGLEIRLPEVSKQTTFNDPKTTLNRTGIDLIGKINDDIIAYLFIEKYKQSSSWNLVAPMLLEKSTGKLHQYGLNYFALEGCGGGLRNISLLLHHLKKHKEKGFEVHVLPKIVDNDLLNKFEYVDSGIKLTDLIEHSIDLINYRKGPFEYIFKQYEELITEYTLE